MLEGAGFQDVANLEGGMQAWNGLVASGPPEGGMAYFTDATRPAEMIALAWYLEAGSKAFYAAIAASGVDRDTAALFGELDRAEERHMGRLRELHERLAGAASPADFPQGIVAHKPPDALMEGGVAVAKALIWARALRDPADLLEFCISLEANSYDLYLRMAAATSEAQAREVFELLAAEEQTHLERMVARHESLTSLAAGDVHRQ